MRVKHLVPLLEQVAKKLETLMLYDRARVFEEGRESVLGKAHDFHVTDAPLGRDQGQWPTISWGLLELVRCAKGKKHPRWFRVTDTESLTCAVLIRFQDEAAMKEFEALCDKQSDHSGGRVSKTDDDLAKLRINKEGV